MAKKYSVAEIDDLRTAIWWSIAPRGVGFDPKEIGPRVEDLLRTYMLNGTSAAEVRDFTKLRGVK